MKRARILFAAGWGIFAIGILLGRVLGAAFMIEFIEGLGCGLGLMGYFKMAFEHWRKPKTE